MVSILGILVVSFAAGYVTATGGACFYGGSLVETPKGPKKVKDLQPGDLVRTLTTENQLIYSPVIFQLHAPNDEIANLKVIVTSQGHVIRLTPDHVMFVGRNCFMRDFRAAKSVFASDVQVGDCVYVSKSPDGFDRPEIDSVTKIEDAEFSGVYAPVTQEGTIIVDNILASCYAFFPDHWKIHNVFSVFNYFPPQGWPHLQEMFYEMSLNEIGSWLVDISSRVSFTKDLGVCFKNGDEQMALKNAENAVNKQAGNEVVQT